MEARIESCDDGRRLAIINVIRTKTGVSAWGKGAAPCISLARTHASHASSHADGRNPALLRPN